MGVLNSLMLLFCSTQPHRPTTAAEGEVGIISRIEDIIRGLIPTSAVLRRIDYQPFGAGKSASMAWCDPALVLDAAAWLAERIGPLAWCRRDDETDPPPPDPPKPEPAPVEQLAEAALDDSGLWPADDPGWSDDPRWMPEYWDGHKNEGVAAMTLDECRSLPAGLLLSPGAIYPAETPRSLFMELITDVFRIGRRSTVHEASIPWVGNDASFASVTAAQIGVRETRYPLVQPP